MHLKRTAVRHRGLERAFGKQLDRAAIVDLDFSELDRFVSARAECDRVHLKKLTEKNWGG